jgi:hypothetical protein
VDADDAWEDGLDDGGEFVVEGGGDGDAVEVDAGRGGGGVWGRVGRE